MAGEIDTSIALQAGRPSINMLNPLEVARQGAEYRNALLGNKIRQSEYDARVAQGNALLGATDADGQVDYAKARAAMARDPAAAYGAVDAYRQQNASRNDDLQNAEASKNAVGSIMSFVGANPDAAHLDAGARMAKAVLPKSQWGQIDAIVHQIGSHPNGIAGGVAQITNSMQAPQGQEQNVYGAPDSIDTGNAHLIGTRSSAMRGGGFNATQAAPKNLSPDLLSHPYEYTDENGRKRVTTVGAILQANGLNVSPAPISPTNAQGQMPSGAENYPWNSGRYGGVASQSGSSSPTPRSMETGLAPGQEEAAQSAGHEAGAQYAAANQSAAGFAQRQYQSRAALSALEKLGPTGTGPGSEGRNQIVSYAQTLGFTAPSDTTRAYDEANKYLTQMAMAQPGATGSNERLSTALSGNASTHISNLAAQDVVKANIALDRQNQAALLGFNQKYPGSKSQLHANEWPSYAAEWSSHVDPRVYAFDLMTPQQRTTMMKGWDTEKRSQFYQQVQGAVDHGLVTPPR